MQCRLPGRQGRIATFFVILSGDLERAQRSLLFGAVPALEKNHSIPMSLPQYYGMNAQLLDFRTEFKDLRANNFDFLVVHVAFPES